MLLDKIEELADEKQVIGNDIKYHFNKGIIVKSPNINGVYIDIIHIENGELLFFKEKCCYARVLEKRDFPNTEICKGD